MDKRELEQQYLREYKLFVLSDGNLEFANDFVKTGNALRQREETREL